MSDRIRLDRFLAQEGTGSRSDVKKMIRSGRIRVNGQDEHSGERKIDPDEDEVLVDGKPVRRTSSAWIMLNKPSGVVSATKDGKFRTVVDLIREPWAGKLFPVGRLDKDTEGLLLLTEDGELCHALLSPKRHVGKTYFAVISGAPDQELARRFLEGVEIGEKRKTLPARLHFLSENDIWSAENDFHFVCAESSEEKTDSADGYPSALICLQPEDYERCGENECCVVITIMEGKFHQIKRMFGAFGREVHFLKRIAMGALKLDPALKPGQYRPLTAEEIRLLRSYSKRAEDMKSKESEMESL